MNKIFAFERIQAHVYANHIVFTFEMRPSCLKLLQTIYYLHFSVLFIHLYETDTLGGFFVFDCNNEFVIDNTDKRAYKNFSF